MGNSRGQLIFREALYTKMSNKKRCQMNHHKNSLHQGENVLIIAQRPLLTRVVGRKRRACKELQLKAESGIIKWDVKSNKEA